jgi:hypothetical protein
VTTAALLAGIAATSAAVAQQRPDVIRRLERQQRQFDATFRYAVPPDQPIAERLLMDYGGSARFGFYSIDDAGGSSHFLRQSDAILYLRAELDGAHRFFGRLRFLYNDYNSGDDFDGRGDDLDEPIGDRYWYEFDARGAHLAATGERLGWNVNARGGRQWLDWGSGLAFSNTLLGGVASAELGPVNLRGVAGVTPGSSTVDFDGSRPGFDSDTSRGYYGLLLEYAGLSAHRPYVYYLMQRDYNSRDFRVFRTIAADIPTSFDYDSEYLGFGSRGSFGRNLAYRAEVIQQMGEGLSNSFDPATGLPAAQTREDIDAWAGLAGLTWLFLDANDSRLDFEVVAGSGDDDRLDASNTFGGNAPGTDDEAFNGLGYVNTGLALAPEISNLLSLRLGASTSLWRSPHRPDRVRVGVNGFLFTKLDDDAPLNIRTVPGESFLGGEIDLLLDWRVTSDLSLSVRYGIFIPADAMPAGEADPRHFFYFGATYGF